jgi:hypothetical protein
MKRKIGREGQEDEEEEEGVGGKGIRRGRGKGKGKGRGKGEGRKGEAGERGKGKSYVKRKGEEEKRENWRGNGETGKGRRINSVARRKRRKRILLIRVHSCICSPQVSGGVLSSFPKNLGKKPLMQAIAAPFCRHFPKTLGKNRWCRRSQRRFVIISQKPGNKTVDDGDRSIILSPFPYNLEIKPLTCRRSKSSTCLITTVQNIYRYIYK